MDEMIKSYYMKKWKRKKEESANLSWRVPGKAWLYMEIVTFLLLLIFWYCKPNLGPQVHNMCVLLLSHRPYLSIFFIPLFCPQMINLYCDLKDILVGLGIHILQLILSKEKEEDILLAGGM